MAMADAQHMHASKMARGESEYQGKLLEARQSDWKDEFVLIVLTLPILVIAWGVLGRSWRSCKDKRVLRIVPAAPVMVHKFMDPCRGERLWYKGHTDF